MAQAANGWFARREEKENHGRSLARRKWRRGSTAIWPVSQVVERSERKDTRMEERGRTKNINGMKYFFRGRGNGLIAVLGEYKRLEWMFDRDYFLTKLQDEILEACRIAWWPRSKEITRSRVVGIARRKGVILARRWNLCLLTFDLR